MKTFKCSTCANTVYFENIQCLRCRSPLGFEPDRLSLVKLAPTARDAKVYRESKKPSGLRLCYCANESHGVCNWLVTGKPR